jgi:hypothetical protein
VVIVLADIELPGRLGIVFGDFDVCRVEKTHIPRMA